MKLHTQTFLSIRAEVKNVWFSEKYCHIPNIIIQLFLIMRGVGERERERERE